MLLGGGCRAEGNRGEKTNGTTVISQPIKHTLKVIMQPNSSKDKEETF